MQVEIFTSEAIVKIEVSFCLFWFGLQIPDMAVFMLNICKFNGCGKTFRKLGDLIQHIEEKHIDYDPRVVEQKELQQPACLPLSYVLRFYTEAARKDTSPTTKITVSPPPRPVITASLNSSTSSRSPPESDVEDEEVASETEDSNDSWTTPEEFSSEFILRQGSKNACNNTGDDKPFTCPVPGCKKKYKNVNGIKYHAKNGHKKETGKIRKAFRCPCGKSYRSSSGLKNHTQAAHSSGGEGLKTLPIRTVTSLAVLDPSFTLVAKGRQGNMVQLGILTPALSQSPSTPLTLTPIHKNSPVPGL